MFDPFLFYDKILDSLLQPYLIDLFFVTYARLAIREFFRYIKESMGYFVLKILKKTSDRFSVNIRQVVKIFLIHVVILRLRPSFLDWNLFFVSITNSWSALNGK